MLFKTIQLWKNIAGKSKHWWILFFTAVLANIISLLEPIAIAKVIDSMYLLDKNLASLWLLIALLLYVSRNLVLSINYKFYPKVVGRYFLNIQTKIFDKLGSLKLIEKHKKEYFISIVDSDILDVSSFADTLSNRFADLFKIFVIIVYVATYSWVTALFIIAVSFVNLLVIGITNRQIVNSHKLLTTANDRIVEKLSDSIDGRQVIDDFNLHEKFRREYEYRNLDFYYYLKKNTRSLSAKDNYIGILWGIFQASIIYFLIISVGNVDFSLTIFLVIVPYISSVITKMKDFMDLYNDSRKCFLMLLRIQTIFESESENIASLGRLKPKNRKTKLAVINLCIDSNYINLHLKENQYKVIKTLTNSQIHRLFSMLELNIPVPNGKIYITSIDINKLDQREYNNLISIVRSQPYFFNDSIIKNLQLVETKKRTIYTICKTFGISEMISKLDLGYSSNMQSGKISSFLMFMLGLVRSFLSNSEVIIIEKFKAENSHENMLLKRAYRIIARERTLSLFEPKLMNKNIKTTQNTCVEEIMKNNKKQTKMRSGKMSGCSTSEKMTTNKNETNCCYSKNSGK